jgi:hypothetical protein
VFVTGERDKEFSRVVSGCFYAIARGFVLYPPATGGERDRSVLCTAIQPDQFPHRMVKSGPQIVNRIADDKRQRGWKIRIDNAGSDHSSCSIMFDSDQIWIVPDAREDELQISDVMLGPI